MAFTPVELFVSVRFSTRKMLLAIASFAVASAGYSQILVPVFGGVFGANLPAYATILLGYGATVSGAGLGVWLLCGRSEWALVATAAAAIACVIAIHRLPPAF